MYDAIDHFDLFKKKQQHNIYLPVLRRYLQILVALHFVYI